MTDGVQLACQELGAWFLNAVTLKWTLSHVVIPVTLFPVGLYVERKREEWWRAWITRRKEYLGLWDVVWYEDQSGSAEKEIAKDVANVTWSSESLLKASSQTYGVGPYAIRGVINNKTIAAHYKIKERAGAVLLTHKEDKPTELEGRWVELGKDDTLRTGRTTWKKHN